MQLVVYLLLVVPLIPAMIGLTILWVGNLRPARLSAAAGDWIETPCVIEAIGFETERGKRALTWVSVSYRYRFADQDYTSQKYDFYTDLAGGRQDVGALSAANHRYVADHPAGTRTVCYVNPEQPSEAVLLRDRNPGWVSTIVPFTFILIGLVATTCVARLIAKVRKEVAQEMSAETAREDS